MAGRVASEQRQTAVSGAERILDDRLEHAPTRLGLLVDPAPGVAPQRVNDRMIGGIGDRRGGQGQAAELGIPEERLGVPRRLLCLEFGGVAPGAGAMRRRTVQARSSSDRLRGTSRSARRRPGPPTSPCAGARRGSGARTPRRPAIRSGCCEAGPGPRQVGRRGGGHERARPAARADRASPRHSRSGGVDPGPASRTSRHRPGRSAPSGSNQGGSPPATPSLAALPTPRQPEPRRPADRSRGRASPARKVSRRASGRGTDRVPRVPGPASASPSASATGRPGRGPRAGGPARRAVDTSIPPYRLGPGVTTLAPGAAVLPGHSWRSSIAPGPDPPPLATRRGRRPPDHAPAGRRAAGPATTRTSPPGPTSPRSRRAAAIGSPYRCVVWSRRVSSCLLGAESWRRASAVRRPPWPAFVGQSVAVAMVYRSLCHHTGSGTTEARPPRPWRYLDRTRESRPPVTPSPGVALE